MRTWIAYHGGWLTECLLLSLGETTGLVRQGLKHVAVLLHHRNLYALLSESALASLELKLYLHVGLLQHGITCTCA